MIKFLVIVCVGSVMLTVPPALAQIDINGNGTKDLPVTTARGGELLWFGKDLTTGELVELGPFGHPGYQAHIGHWTDQKQLTRVFVRKTPFGLFELVSDSNDFGYPLGVSNADAVVVIGRDIDSSGVQDAVLVHSNRRKWSWKLSLDPLTSHGGKRGLLFGRTRDIPFLFRSRGSQDSLALLIKRGKRARIVYRPLYGRRKRTIRIRGFTPPEEQPLLIRGGNGRDSFAFRQNNKLIQIGRRGSRGNSISIPENGTILIDNFQEDSEDEIAFFTEGKLFFLNGRSQQLGAENLMPLNSRPAREYESNEASPTIAATRTPTAKPSQEPIPTSIPTATVLSTPTPMVTVMVTAVPTWTVQPTWTPSLTPTPQPTFTLQPTLTPQPTQTPLPTYTFYPTFTSTPTVVPTNTSTPVPTPVTTGTPPVVAAVRADCKAHLNAGETNDRVYWVDPDGAGTGLDPMQAYCDLTTDGGGWTLILNYLHKGGTSPGAQVRTSELPLLGGTTLGTDESASPYWGHAGNSLANSFSASEVRFRCITSYGSSGVVHFKSSDLSTLSYVRSGFGSMAGLSANHVLFSDHTAVIPQSIKGSLNNQGDQALTNASFYGPANETWYLGNNGQWECDDDNDSAAFDTHHQVWIR